MASDGHKQSCADSTVPLAFHGNEIVDVNEPSVDQGFLDVIACKRDWCIVTPGRQYAVAATTLTRDPSDQFIRAGYRGPQQGHHGKTGGHRIVRFGVTQYKFTHAGTPI
jgi:hypothetical protein